MKLAAGLLSWGCAFGVALAPVAASAADSPEIAEAKKRFAEGKSLYADRKYEEARLKYVQACAVLPTDNCLRGLAIAELRADKPADAYRHFKEIFDNPKAMAGIDAAGVRDLQAMRDEAYAKSGHIAVEGPAGLAIVVDGVDAGITPIAGTLDVTAGVHQVAVRGDAKRSLPITASAGQVVKAHFSEEATAPAPAPALAPALAPAPAPASAPTPAPADASAEIHPAESSARTITILALGGAAVVATGLGVYFLTAAGNADDDVQRLKAANPNCVGPPSQGCADLASAADSRTTDRNLATVSFVGAGAFVVGAVVTYFVWKPRPARPLAGSAVVVHPSASPNGAGLNIAGWF
jgi:hypothetical protein